MSIPPVWLQIEVISMNPLWEAILCQPHHLTTHRSKLAPTLLNTLVVANALFPTVPPPWSLLSSSLLPSLPPSILCTFLLPSLPTSYLPTYLPLFFQSYLPPCLLFDTTNDWFHGFTLYTLHTGTLSHWNDIIFSFFDWYIVVVIPQTGHLITLQSRWIHHHLITLRIRRHLSMIKQGQEVGMTKCF